MYIVVMYITTCKQQLTQVSSCFLDANLLINHEINIITWKIVWIDSETRFSLGFQVKVTAVDVVVCLCVIFSGSFLCHLNCAHTCMGMVAKISPLSQDTF